MTGERGIKIAALVVAGSAAVASAHGMFAVADASQLGFIICCLYPLMTDGYVVVAYWATHRFPTKSRSSYYAWTVVVGVMIVSAIAQGAYLYNGTEIVAPPWLRGGVGCWPAIAITGSAHLVWLLFRANRTQSPREDKSQADTASVSNTNSTAPSEASSARSMSPPSVKAGRRTLPEHELVAAINNGADYTRLRQLGVGDARASKLLALHASSNGQPS